MVACYRAPSTQFALPLWTQVIEIALRPFLNELLSLAFKGLTMSGLALSMTVTLKNDGSFLMDPTKVEEENGTATITTVFNISKQGLIASHTEGALLNALNNCIFTDFWGCRNVY